MPDRITQGAKPRPSLDRARGALLGLAVGDALGTTREFSRPDAPPFPVLATGPQTSIVGGGPFNVQSGQVTDDTHMATCLAASLRDLGCFNADDVAERYVAWTRVAFDVGAQTSASLFAVGRGVPALEAGVSVWRSGGRSAAGNGSLMRTAPLGVFFAGDPNALRRASLDDSAITHADPRCQLACAAFNAAIASALTNPELSEPRVLMAIAFTEIAIAGDMLARERPEDALDVHDAVRTLHEDLDLAMADDPRLYGPEIHLHDHQGFVRVAFRLAFWELLHAPTYQTALIDSINRGGDADTNGAIVGALLGAFHGADAIPRAWELSVLTALQGGRPGPFRDLYHPLRLVELLEVLP